MTKLRSSPKPIMGVSISNTFCMPIQVFFLLTNMGVLRPPICYIIASHLILFICLCLIYIRDELVNLPWQWKYCWYVLCTANMYDHYDFFYLFQSFFLFLHKIIHLRKINDFIPTKICACEKEGRFSRWAQQLTCGKSLSLRHNIVHIWGQPQLLVKLRFIEKKKISVQTYVVFSLRIIFVKSS